ncbi:MAG: hypothetical protein H6725_20180 [Sandaracinaceae bacterium]|nr:hypothetical protein [Sandaracinaceae bacterium]
MTKRKAVRPKLGGVARPLPAQDANEARVMEAARSAYRLAKKKLHDARDPASSKAAYEAVWAAVDEVGKAIVESVEGEEADEDPDEFTDAEGAVWKRVTEDPADYHSLRGTIRVRRKRHRSVRNGPTRCLFDERRGVMARNTMPDLGEAMLRTYADVPGDESAKLLTALTGHAVSPSRIKRFVTEEATHMHVQEQAFFDAELAAPDVPSEASTLVISVDALSLHLREEGWKQATVGVLTLLDADGEPLRRGAGINATRIAEMPEAGKQTIMARIEREVGALVAQRPDLEIEVVIDGAPDLRTHLLERFPKARHLTDFFHVAEHLAAALRLLFPDDDARRATERASWCHKLKHKEGTPFRLWRWLRDEMKRELDPVSPWAKREVEKHAEYIYNQRPWMKYPQAVAANAAIGSGPVEAACKTLVTQRLKISGATWSRIGAAGVLYLRSLLQSDRFHRAFSFMQAARYAA